MTIKDYILKNYDRNTINDITSHGCVSGCATTLIYYKDTIAFHDKYEDEIWDRLYNDAQDQGITICELIASFNGQKNVGGIDQFKNLLTWYAVESVCLDIQNED